MKRNVFLMAMVVLANVYLVGFAADALLSFADEALSAAGNKTLSPLRNLVAGLVLLATPVMALIVLFVPHLPKLVFLPLIVFIVWAAFGAVPLFPANDNESMLLLLMGLQVALAVGAFLILKARTGSWLLSAAALPYKRHLVARTVAAAAFLIVALPILAGALGLFAIAAVLEAESGGYLDVTSSGIDVRETILTKDEKTVYLVGMMHIGETAFYRTVFEGFPSDALILAEGVSDRQNLLSSDLSYHRVARVLGLEQQPALADQSGAGAQPDEPATDAGRNEEPGGSVDARATGMPEVRPADVDISEFSEVTLRFLNAVADFYASRSVIELIRNSDPLSNEFSEEDYKLVFSDLIGKRNDRLMAEFDAAIVDYDAVVIPWGAMHMPGLEAALRERGFSAAPGRVIPVVRFRNLIDRWTAAPN